MGEQFEFQDKDGKVIWYTSVSAEGITFEYEERIGGADGMNIETIYKIPNSEYSSIEKIFNIQYELPMSLILKLIAKEGLGNHFRELVLDGKIKSERFIWINWLSQFSGLARQI